MLLVHRLQVQEELGAVSALRDRFAEYSHFICIFLDSFYKYTTTPKKLSSAQYIKGSLDPETRVSIHTDLT